MTPSLVCPLCSEGLNEEGSHFYRHFKYRRYACGESTCDAEFYTEIERNQHCSEVGHKRSFQKTVNPYIDRMIAMLVHDARELATKDMETVLENRWGVIEPDCRIVARTPASSESTPAVVVPMKKKRASMGEGTSSKKATPTTSKETPKRTVPEVDSTTDEPVTAEKQKKTRKRRIESEKQPNAAAPQSYEAMSAVDKLIGWYDPNVPERVDAAKVKCAVCNEEIVYDYIIRRGHVTERHMAADVDPRDYCDMLNVAMDRSFPDLPNSTLACQLCMTGADIRKPSRREHIEKFHTTSLPPLECPHGECARGYRRQCELSTHMRELHKSDMSRLKNPEFQRIRRRRNFMINEMINKCFPWSKLEGYEQTTSSSVVPAVNSVGNVDATFGSDVRVLDVNKTRRAPQYNNRESSSSDSEDDEETASMSERTGAQKEQDVVFIGYQFNSEVVQKLSFLNTMANVKKEVVEQEEVPEPVKEENPEETDRVPEVAVPVENIELPPMIAVPNPVAVRIEPSPSAASISAPLPNRRPYNDNYSSSRPYERSNRDQSSRYNYNRSYNRNGRDPSPRRHHDRRYDRSYPPRTHGYRW